MNIVVLAGGLSTERDVSIITGTQVCKALRKKGHKAILLDVFFGYNEDFDLNTIFDGKESLLLEDAKIQTTDPDLNEIKALRGGDTSCFLGPNVIEICKKADIVYMGLHGAEGENGKIQATFDVLGIRYTGSGYLGSAIAMDKGMAKKVFLTAGIPTPEGYTVTKSEGIADGAKIAYPCIVKPCCGGSSVGVSMATNDEEYKKALELGFRYEEELLVEECIKGREFSVGVIDGKSLPIIEIIPKTGFYDYETKYQPGMATDVCPAELSEELTKQMQEYAVAVYRELKLETYGRIDFLLNDKNEMFCLEANTLPGMTPTSLLPQEAKEIGLEYGDLCEQIIGKSLEKYEGKKKRTNVAGGNYTLGDMIPVWTSPMQGMSLDKIVKACDGVYYGPTEAIAKNATMITIDSRQIEKDCIFVAIKGARVDGNDFVEQAYEDGAFCCISEVEPVKKDRPYIVVKSCYQALKDMAKLYRNLMKTEIIGITGSVGKTTTKEMIASVLSERFHTLKTKGNFNNEVGVPLTLFSLREEHEVAIVEMGISEFGEMTRLSEMAQPDRCVITNIGQCHLENLGDRDGVLKAKTEIFKHMHPKARIYLNGDDDKLVTVKADDKNLITDSDVENTNAVCARRITFFGVENTSGVYAKRIENLGLKGTKATVVTPKSEFDIAIPVPGHHMVLNALAAVAIATDLGMTEEEIQRGIVKFKPVGGHSSMIETDKFIILDDCYNANPVSMKAGIDVLGNALGRKVAIVGDMFELGADEVKMHYEVGEYAAKSSVDLLVCIGDLAKNIYDGAIDWVKAADSCDKAKVIPGILHFATMEEAVETLNDILEKDDTILVKASHGMHFEKIVAVLKEM